MVATQDGYPVFVGATAAEVIAAAHAIPSLSSLDWLKVAHAEQSTDHRSFCSGLLQWQVSS